MPLFTGRDGSGKEITFIQEEGYNYPKLMVDFIMKGDLKTKLHDVKNFAVKDDDVFICAFMKSGKVI